MAESTKQRIGDNIDLEVLDPRWPKDDNPPDRAAPDPADSSERHAVDAGPASATLRSNTRRLRVVVLVIAATVAASASTRWLAPRTRTYTPPWTAACREAITATAQLHRVQDMQFAQGMEDAWALIGTGEVPKPNPIDTSLNARLQRAADNATSRCISPATPRA